MVDVNIQLDWSGAEEIPARPANMVFVQATREEYVLTFGQTLPPTHLSLASDDDAADYFKENRIKIHHLTRLTLTPGAAKILVQALGGLLHARGEAAADSIEQEGLRERAE